jgi:hypothetical protein
LDWCIGDIHGCFYTLQRLIDRISKVDSSARFIFLGDYFDRGLHSNKVVDLLIQLQSGGAVCLRGNHDDVIDEIINGGSCTVAVYFPQKPPEMQQLIEWWKCNGFDETAISYGMKSHLSLGANLDQVGIEFRKNIPDSHKKFVKDDLVLWWENKTHFACHGYYPPHWGLENNSLNTTSPNLQLLYASLWDRFMQDVSGNLLIQDHVWDKIGVFGHSPVKCYNSPTPIASGKLRLIDTGACSNDYLCGYCCQNDNWILQSTEKEDIQMEF